MRQNVLSFLSSDNLSMIEETDAEGLAETSLMDNIDKRFNFLSLWNKSNWKNGF